MAKKRYDLLGGISQVAAIVSPKRQTWKEKWGSMTPTTVLDSTCPRQQVIYSGYPLSLRPGRRNIKTGRCLPSSIFTHAEGGGGD